MNTQQLWQAQALDAPRISLAFLREQEDVLRRRTQIRNAAEYIGGAASIGIMVWAGLPLISVKPLFFLATALWIAGALASLYLWHRRASSLQQPAEFGVLDALRFHRLQLERQRDVRRGQWRWWMPCALPGIAMTFVALFVEITPTPWTAIVILAVWIAFGFTMSIVVYEHGARRIQKEIDALDSL